MEYYLNLEIETIDGEIWKDVVGGEGLYMVSNFGRVKSVERTDFVVKKKGTHIANYNSRIMRQEEMNCGYLRVCLRMPNKRRHILVHRLVADAFISNLENKRCVNHRDCNKKNNTLPNLEWVTHSENRIHAIKNNLVKRRFTENDIFDIRNMFKDGSTHKQISVKYGVSRSFITNIINTNRYYADISSHTCI